MPVHSADELPETTPAVAEARDDTPELPLPNATPSEGICTETSSPAEHDPPEPVTTSSETSTPTALTESMIIKNRNLKLNTKIDENNIIVLVQLVIICNILSQCCNQFISLYTLIKNIY